MKNRTSGFTLVELMVVVVLVAVVVLVSTQIPLFTFSFWRKGMERLKLQRDANYVMIKIQHELRPASLSIYDRINVSEDGSTLVIDGESFALEGDYDPEFTVISGDGTISITLTLVKENVGTIILRTAVKPRN